MDGWGRRLDTVPPDWIKRLDIYSKEYSEFGGPGERYANHVWPGPGWFACDIAVLLAGLVAVARMLRLAVRGPKRDGPGAGQTPPSETGR